jgi:hypothetical protein
VNRTRNPNGRQYRWWEVRRTSFKFRIHSQSSPTANNDQPQQLISESETTRLVRHSSRSPSRNEKYGIEYWLPHPDNLRFHDNIISRFLRKFPFLIEIWYWALTYWPYQLMRAETALWINSSAERREAVFKLAKHNAIRVLRIEESLGIAVEQRLQHFLLTKCKSSVMTLLCDIYLSHITVGIAFLGYGYTYYSHLAG